MINDDIKEIEVCCCIEKKKDYRKICLIYFNAIV